VKLLNFSEGFLEQKPKMVIKMKAEMKMVKKQKKKRNEKEDMMGFLL
jgi:hypothetical protein